MTSIPKNAKRATIFCGAIEDACNCSTAVSASGRGRHFHGRQRELNCYDATSTPEHGSSTIRVDDPQRERLQFDFKLTDGARYPFVSAELTMDDGKGQPAFEDWSKYTTVTFLAKCAPANSMIVAITTFNEKVSTKGELRTYRSPGTFFSCNKNGGPVTVDTTRLIIPEWWLWSMKLDLADQGYVLNKVAKIVFGTSANSPHNVDFHVEISDV